MFWRIESSAGFQADRLSVQQRMFQYLKTKLEGSEVLSESNNTAVVAEEPAERGMFTFAISLSLENTVLPFRYQEAVAAKQSANEDIALVDFTLSDYEANERILSAFCCSLFNMHSYVSRFKVIDSSKC